MQDTFQEEAPNALTHTHRCTVSWLLKSQTKPQVKKSKALVHQKCIFSFPPSQTKLMILYQKHIYAGGLGACMEICPRHLQVFNIVVLNLQFCFVHVPPRHLVFTGNTKMQNKMAICKSFNVSSTWPDREPTQPVYYGGEQRRVLSA